MDFGWLGLFTAGLATFLTPCVLPLVPVYLTALLGADIRQVEGTRRLQLVTRALFFSIGFLSVFIALGVAASSVGSALSQARNWMKVFGGFLIILFGLHFLGFVRIPLLERTVRADDRKLQTRFGIVNAVIMGVVFAAGWSPCAGPILGAVLTYTASSAADPWLGAAYLATYGAGFALPLVIVSAFAGEAVKVLKKLTPHLRRIEAVIGALLVIVGLGLVHDGVAPPAKSSTPAVAEKSGSPADVTEGEPVVLAFTSKDCAVCKRMKPVMESVRKQCDGRNVRVRIVEITEPENTSLVRRFHLLATPTFVFLDADGNEVARLVGEQTEQTLKQAISTLRGEPCPGVTLLPSLDGISKNRSGSGCDATKEVRDGPGRKSGAASSCEGK
ncbi:MAG: hypothetical protein D6806_17035 [Deltaproteobacteria bacterium]|nr:MAG: hypothetical protein D6806_17035 [Deltaproteobacteria bacterium]